MEEGLRSFMTEVGGGISLDAKPTIVFLFTHPHGDLANLVDNASDNLVWPVAQGSFFSTYGPGIGRKGGLFPLESEEVLRLRRTHEENKASGKLMAGACGYAFESTIEAALASIEARAPMRIVICSCDAAHASASPSSLGVIPGDEVIFLAQVSDCAAASSFAAVMQQAAPWAVAMTGADLRKVGALVEALERSSVVPMEKKRSVFRGGG